MQRHRGLTLWSIKDIDEGGSAPPASEPALRATVAWSRAFLLPGHPALGRDGPVCPFTKTAMERDLFLLACPNIRNDVGSMTNIMLRYRDWYRQCAGALDERTRAYLTFLVLFPRVDHMDASEFDALQARLKDNFVEEGLMIGQFHPACDQPGIWNETFRPLRSPVPLLAIRAMVRYDLPFLVEKSSHVEAYRRYFGSRRGDNKANISA
jgi:hypothetical protein